ncbi:hypothetical protein SteCoe_30672 [Stentor coeruleus]|uniref:Uncharacterized protein n=1 Tax=Stentor coeruleus TaxID=5963 RepID=A0A1R2B353_9CILI|nr:hypothetical protein SteCoe_30672 [Stentor coeruleus]
MSEKADSNPESRSMSQIAPRKKRVVEAWTSSPKPSTENLLKISTQQLPISEVKKTVTEKPPQNIKTDEETQKSYNKTLEEKPKTQETAEKNPEKTPENPTKFPEKNPEPQQKLQINLKQDFNQTTGMNMTKIHTYQPPKASTPQNFISSRPSYIQNKKTITPLNTKETLLYTPIVASVASPKSANILSPSTFSNKKLYELDDERLDILKQKQSSWPWAYRIGEQSALNLDTKPKVLQNDGTLYQTNIIPRKCASVEEPSTRPIKSTSPGHFIFPSCLDPSLLRSTATELFKKKINTQREPSIQSTDTEIDTNSRGYRGEILYLKGEIDTYKEKVLKTQEALEKALEKHQIEIKNYKKEVDLKDNKIHNLNTKASEIHADLKKKIIELETKLSKESNGRLTKHGQEINDLTQQVKDLQKIINDFNNDKKTKEDLFNKIIQDLNDMVINNTGTIMKLENELLDKDKEIFELKGKLIEKEITSEGYGERLGYRRDKRGSVDINTLLKKESKEKEELVIKLEKCERLLKDERERSKKEIERLGNIIKDQAKTS